jgi:peptidoglycan/LPS O-acetylase OafA/YrhL
MIFPLLFFGIISQNATVRWSSAGAALVGFLFVGKTISLYFLIWLMGALINIFPPPRQRNGTFSTITAVAAFLLVLALSRIPTFASAPFAADFILGLATSTLIHTVLGDYRQINSKRSYARIAAGLGHSSYTLYLVHLPFLVLINSRVAQAHRWQPTARTVASGWLILVAVLIYAGTVAHFTERRTDRFRRRLTYLIEPSEDACLARDGRQSTIQP